MLYFFINLILSIQLGVIFYQATLFTFHLRNHKSIVDPSAYSKRSFTIFFCYLLLLNFLLFLISFSESAELFYYFGLIGLFHSIAGLLLIPVMSFFSNRAMTKAFSISHAFSLYIMIFLGISSIVGIYQLLLDA